MNRILKQFKVNQESKGSDSIEILFDFIVVALVSLLFNGFIINGFSSTFDQKYLMVSNAMLLSTHWYSYNFFRQRYEKKNSFFRIWSLFNVLALAVMAIGVDLLVFRENQAQSSKDFLVWVGPAIIVIGFIMSRLSMGLQFMLAATANRENKKIVKLSANKAISRLINVFIAIAHLLLIILTRNIALTTYIFFPIYLVVEILGNIIFVNKNNLTDVPSLSTSYTKNRYSKLTLLYIASFFISGTIQFAYYFTNVEDLYMIPRLIMVYLIGFMLWWIYMDRIHRFQMKDDVKSLKRIALGNVLLVGSLSVFGGMLINASNDTNLEIIIPSVSFATSLVLLIIYINFFSLKANSKTKKILPIQVIPIILYFISLAIASLFIDMSVWVLYVSLLITFSILNVASRITINKVIKP